MAELEEFRVEGNELFRREEVLMQANKDDILHSGLLTVTDTKYGVYITWKILEKKAQEPQFSVGSPPDSTEWAVIGRNAATPKGCVKFRSNSTEQDSPAVKFSSSLKEKQLSLTAEVADVKSYRLADDGNTVTLLMKDGTRHNTLIFLEDGPEEFLETFTSVMSIRQSATDQNLYLLTDKKISALDQSLTELNLFERPNSETVWRAIEEFQHDPYHSSLNILSKVAEKLLFSPTEIEYRPPEEMAELLQGETVASSTVQGEGGNGEESDNWQLVSSRRSLLKSLEDLPRSAPVCQLDWELHVHSSGVIEDVPDLLEKIYRGGIEENVRSEAWKYLLGYYHWQHTYQERETYKEEKLEEYQRMKVQWKTVTEDQQNRFAGFRERKTQIEKDIGRTDRSHPFYSGDDNTNVALLEEVLMTYVMYNFDLGYVQGMSDLLSPLLFVMKNEVDAFWCFVGLMDRVGSNFEFDQGGMKRQLSQLTVILKYIDISFFNYLESKESGNLFFCFRWLLICFKREFNYSDTMQLWEVLWTKKPCKNFHLLLCVSLLEFQKTTIMENKYGFNEILKHINDLSLRIDLNKMLCRADAIYRLIGKDPTVPDQVLNILGIVPESGAGRNVNGKTNSIAVPTNGNCDRKRRGTDCSAGSSSLNHSSSVEVLSEGEEGKFEDSISSNFF